MIVHSFQATSAAKNPDPQTQSSDLVWPLLLEHFGPLRPEDLSISERQFPFRVRVDLQAAIDRLLAGGGVRRFAAFGSGINLKVSTFPRCSCAIRICRLSSHRRITRKWTSERTSRRRLKNGLWLLDREDQRYAVLLSPHMVHGRADAVQIQVIVLNNPAGAKITERLFRALEEAVADCHSYRGKILSLEADWNYSGQATGIKVHKLRKVDRDQVILPAATLELLDRNIVCFVERRKKLAEHGQPTKKGILFYGPPGTGKSHTIHYLAGSLKRTPRC